MKLPQTTFPAPPVGSSAAAKVMGKSDLGKLYIKALQPQGEKPVPAGKEGK